MNVHATTDAASPADPFIVKADALREAAEHFNAVTDADGVDEANARRDHYHALMDDLACTSITSPAGAVRAAELLAAGDALLSEAARDAVKRSVRDYLGTLGGGNAAAPTKASRRNKRTGRAKAKAKEPVRDVTSPPPQALCSDQESWNYVRLEGCYIDIQSKIKAMRALIMVGHDNAVRTPAREAFEEVLDNLASRIDQLCDDGKAHFGYWVDVGAFK